MLTCLLFGLGVLLTLALVPLGAKWWHTPKYYKVSLFSLYIAGVLWLTLANRWGMEVAQLRLRPFYMWRVLVSCVLKLKPLPGYVCSNIFKNSKSLFDSTHATLIEDILLNIILFIPFGFLVPYIWPKFNFWKTVLTGCFLSACIEATQYLMHWGCCDIDDVLNNTLGTVLGYLFLISYRRVLQK